MREPVKPKVGEHYYCKSRCVILTATRAFVGGNYEFSYMLDALPPIQLHPSHFQYLVHLRNEMEVLACVTRIVDRRERGAQRASR